MNRRSFFKFLGIGAATVVVAPEMIAKSSEGAAKPAQRAIMLDEQAKIEFYKASIMPCLLGWQQESMSSILPPEVQIEAEQLGALDRKIQEMTERQLTMGDLKLLRSLREGIR
jgi:hypothetical protein